MKDKKASIVTIANELGVAPSTVSRAFNPMSKISDEVRKKIIEYANEINYVPNRAAGRLHASEVKIGIIMVDSYDVAVREYMKAFDDISHFWHDYKVTIRTQLISTEHFDEVKSLEKVIKEFNGYDGIVFSGFDGAGCIGCFKKIYETNPNLIFLQSCCESAPRLSFSSHDVRMACDMVAEFIEKCLRRYETKNVLLVTGYQNYVIHRRSAEYFRKSVEKYGLNLVDVVGAIEFDDNFTAMQSIMDVEKKLGGAPDAIFVTTGKALRLFDYISKNSIYKDTVFVTYDTYDELDEYIRNGTIWASVYQNFYGQAYDALDGLIRKILFNEPVSTEIMQNPMMIFKENLNAFKR